MHDVHACMHACRSCMSRAQQGHEAKIQATLWHVFCNLGDDFGWYERCLNGSEACAVRGRIGFVCMQAMYEMDVAHR